MCRMCRKPMCIASAAPRVRARKVSRSRCATAKRWHSCATSKNSSVCQSRSAIDVPIAGSPIMAPPLGSFWPEQLSMLVNDTRATVLRRASQIAVTPNRSASGGIDSIAFLATEDRSATLLQTRSVGLGIEKDHNVPKEELLEFEGLVTEILPDTRYRVQL